MTFIKIFAEFRIRATLEKVECDETSLRLSILNSDGGRFPGRIIQVRYWFLIMTSHSAGRKGRRRFTVVPWPHGKFDWSAT